MTLGQTADRRVAGHRPDRIDVDHHHQRPAAKPGRRQGSLTAGVPGSDHYHIIFWEKRFRHKTFTSKGNHTLERKPIENQKSNLQFSGAEVAVDARSRV
jgi:hypothetical protein